MKKKLLVVCVLSSILFVGCSKNKEMKSSGGERNAPVQEETKISEYLSNKKQQIWYEVDEKRAGKDDTPSGMFVFEDGKVKTYKNVSLTMKEINDMKDKDIIDHVEQKEEEARLGVIDGQIERIKTGEAFDDDKSAYQSEIDKVIKDLNEKKNQTFKVEPVAYSLNVITDSTGNSTVEEEITYKKIEENFSYFDNKSNTYNEGISREYTGSTILKQGYAKFQIYDQWYTGLKTSQDYYFVTKDIDKKGELSFVLDQPDSKNVTVDK